MNGLHKERWEIKMYFNGKTYDFLKFVAMIFAPALATLVGTIGVALGFPEATGVIVTIITAFGTFIGSLVGLSATNYNNTKGDNSENQ